MGSLPARGSVIGTGGAGGGSALGLLTQVQSEGPLFCFTVLNQSPVLGCDIDLLLVY